MKQLNEHILNSLELINETTLLKLYHDEDFNIQFYNRIHNLINTLNSLDVGKYSSEVKLSDDTFEENDISLLFSLYTNLVVLAASLDKNQVLSIENQNLSNQFYDIKNMDYMCYYIIEKCQNLLIRYELVKHY